MGLAQLFIAVFGLAALALALSEKEAQRNRAPFVGLCGQPFWLYVTGSTHQWGMLALSCAYTAVYARAAFVHWKGSR